MVNRDDEQRNQLGSKEEDLGRSNNQRLDLNSMNSESYVNSAKTSSEEDQDSPYNMNAYSPDPKA